MRLLILLLAALPSFAATYYVDFATGANTNNGTAKATPWKHAPGMTGCNSTCGSTTPAAGDSIIFKGGVTWTSGAFPFTHAASGSAGNNIYYGVDLTWFTGGAWVRPIFDFNNAAVSGGSGMAFNNKAYITIDNIEFTNFAYDGSGFCNAMIVGKSGTEHDLLVENVYVHGWRNTSGTDGANNGSLCLVTSGSNNVLTHSKSCNSEFPQGYGVGEEGFDEVAYSEICFVPNNVHGTRLAHDNYIHDGIDSCCGVHEDCFVISSGSVTFYNNVMADCVVEGLFTAPGSGNDTIYNNIIFGVTNYPYEIDTNVAGSSSGGATIYNNTFVTGGQSCIGIDKRSSSLGSIVIKNNLCISTVSPDAHAILCDGGWSGACDPVSSITMANNIVLTPSAATAQGYTAANFYAPTLITNSTVGAGANLTASCSGGFTALCFDTSEGNMRTPVARPAMGAWDSGAYQFTSSGLGGIAAGGSITRGGSRKQQ